MRLPFPYRSAIAPIVLAALVLLWNAHTARVEAQGPCPGCLDPKTPLRDARGALRGFVQIVPGANGNGRVIFYDARSNYVAEIGSTASIATSAPMGRSSFDPPTNTRSVEDKADSQAQVRADIRILQSQISFLKDDLRKLVNKLNAER